MNIKKINFFCFKVDESGPLASSPVASYRRKKTHSNNRVKGKTYAQERWDFVLFVDVVQHGDRDGQNDGYRHDPPQGVRPRRKRVVPVCGGLVFHERRNKYQLQSTYYVYNTITTTVLKLIINK